MIVISFIAVLALTVVASNKKHNAEATDEILEFERSDSILILICLALAFLLESISGKMFPDKYWLIVIVSSGVFSMVLIIVNVSREKTIAAKQQSIRDVYESLNAIYGKSDNFDYVNTPFEFNINKKYKEIDQIVLDIRRDGSYGDNNITIAILDIGKKFPSFEWLYIENSKERTLTFQGHPKPPTLAMFPGSDYRNSAWIPLGLGGEGEVGWNIGDVKDLGNSSFITDEGTLAGTIKSPSAPQAIVLGSTGGGKSIYKKGIVTVKKRAI